MSGLLIDTEGTDCCCDVGVCANFCPLITSIDVTGFMELPAGPTTHPCYPSFPFTGHLVREEWPAVPGGACGWGNWTELGGDFSVHNGETPSRDACGTAATCPQPLIRVGQSGSGLVIEVVYQAFWPDPINEFVAQFTNGAVVIDVDGCPIQQDNRPIQSFGSVIWFCESGPGFGSGIFSSGFVSLFPL